MFKKRFQFNTSKLSIVLYGVIIGFFTGLVVSLFRFLIEKCLSYFQFLYIAARQENLMSISTIVILNIMMMLVVAWFLKKEPNISGSGIPQVEGLLLGEISVNWWSTLWRKFVAGILAIGSGLMLGREGPSIQLGASIGQGIAQYRKLSHNQSKSLIASGAAAGLAAAFNAPLASVMFVLEEVYHSISPFVWVGALTGATVADFVSTVIFGQTPVLAVGNLNVFPVKLYGLLLIFGIILGIFGFLYQKVLLASLTIYAKLKLPKYLYGIIPFSLLIPLGICWPYLLGGGNNIILSLTGAPLNLKLLALMLIIRFIFSMVSYGSGLPGGIFLPILTLGALFGAFVGELFVSLNMMSTAYIMNFVVIGMAGYFACIGKAPFTAIILIFEMVGSVTHILPLAFVSLIAYLMVDLLNGEPIYESLLDRLLNGNKHVYSDSDVTTIEIPVLAGSLMEDQRIRDLNLVPNTLITLIRRSDHLLIPKGDLILRDGDVVFIRASQRNAQIIREQLMYHG
ncbi:ClC family H(+)/Cl(-) exchange transporter [Leuconostoc falkenbergense]|uniref:ClC family H(+)/Cl(-) exchange transporter n=1 Tax=Leuconostoc falkenbergense TaxID=2766470 RepID=UPI0024ACC88D|nr:ClC family H(+)/Cl(-) exchange transporter [Leuconostoc falkenbergense]MDI6667298.1 ClC family H(+)/Cl(-) exchange transporter [Leuconostoc falkenbergense]